MSANVPAVGDEPTPLIVAGVREEDIHMVALILRDPNPIHFDPHAVTNAGLGDRIINQGAATMAYVMNFLTSWVGSRQALRNLACTFVSKVAAGDDVTAGGRVSLVEDVDGGHLVHLDVWADVVGDRRVLAGTATVMWQENAT